MYKRFGGKTKGDCPSEGAEMITFFQVLRRDYPEIAKLATHVRNEGVRTMYQAQKHKSEGMLKGFADIVIIGSPAFVCEMKTKSKNSKLTKEQENFLIEADKAGAFACVAHGYEAALEAVREWKKTIENG